MSNRTFYRSFAILVLATALACTPATGNPDEGITQNQVLVIATPVSDSVIVALNSGIPDRRRLVIRTGSEWAAVWREATANMLPSPPVPQFDFDSEMLLVASMGTRPSGGYSIAIESVHSRGGILYAAVRETSPGGTCMVTGAITAPVVAVRVARTNAPVEFSTQTAVRGC